MILTDEPQVGLVPVEPLDRSTADAHGSTSSGGRTVWMWTLRLLLPLILITAWETAGRTGAIDQFFYSTPGAIGGRIIEWVKDGSLLSGVSITLLEATLGYSIGVAGGLLLGFIAYELPLLGKVGMPFIGAMNAMPRVILAPLFILWFGLGVTSKVVAVSVVVFVVVFYNTYGGLRDVDETLLNSMRVMGARRAHLRRYLLLPAALSWIFGSLRIGLGLAFGGAVVAEYLGSQAGIGYLIATAQSTFDSTGVFAGLVVVTVLVLIILALVGWIEARLQRWKR